MVDRRKEGVCVCARRQVQHHRRQKKRQDQCTRKRQTFVYNPEEEIWHEPYMQCLRKEFSSVSMLCDSKIELPWKDIALPAAGMRIRSELESAHVGGQQRQREVAVGAGVVVERTPAEGEPERRESSGAMALPWQDLLVTEIVPARGNDLATCDSSLEIPWGELTLDRPMEIPPLPREEHCPPGDVEIPWDDILVPRNIVIERDRKKKHPSSRQPPRAPADALCTNCAIQSCCIGCASAKCSRRPHTRA